jgi:hypothetical protein
MEEDSLLQNVSEIDNTDNWRGCGSLLEFRVTLIAAVESKKLEL